MRLCIISLAIAIFACTFVQAGEHAAPAGHLAAAPAMHPSYRLGKAPKPEFNVGGKKYKIDPEARNTKRVRGLPPEEFDPISRRQRVHDFYHDSGKHRHEHRHYFDHDYGPFRGEFLNSTYDWAIADRALWAWHHRVYFEGDIWNEWNAEREFAAQIVEIQRKNPPVEVGYLPPQVASTSPVFVYNDAYLDAAYNPIPFLAVLSLKSLNPDGKTEWIGNAAAESLVSQLSSTPGMFVADLQQVSTVVKDQKLNAVDVTDSDLATHVGKALDVEQVVTGSYVVDGDKVLINLRIVDVQTGAVHGGFSKTVSRDKLLDEMPGLALSLATSLGYQLPNATQDETPDKLVLVAGDKAQITDPVGAPQAPDLPKPVAAWKYDVDGSKVHVVTLYSNGHIGSPSSQSTWSLNGNKLTLRWPNQNAPGGAWIDKCTISPDGKRLNGHNQTNAHIHAVLIEVK